MTMLTKDEAWALATYAVDTAYAQRRVDEIPRYGARYVVWEEPVCGGHLIVAVWSYLPNTKVNEAEAHEFADDLLRELGVYSKRATIPKPTYIL